MKLTNLTEDAFARLVRAAFDIAIVLDKERVIEDISIRKTEFLALGFEAWVGRSWLSTVISEGRVIAQEMFAPQDVNGDLRWQQVNHLMPGGAELPMQYAVLNLDDGRMLALGRNIETISGLQKRMLETQQSTKQDCVHLRHIETNYRIFFEAGHEAMLLVDGLSFRVLDANSSAQIFATDDNKPLVGREITECFYPTYRDEIQSILRVAHATGRIEMCRARIVGASGDCTVSASVFRSESGPYFLMRLLPPGIVDQQTSTAGQQLLFSKAIEHSPVGFLLTDKAGVIKAANEKLITMLGVTVLSELYGQPLENWLVRGGVDWNTLSTNLRSQTVVKDFAIELRMMTGSSIAAEISALALDMDQTYYAFYISDVERTRANEAPILYGMVNSVAELSKLVGRMPMRDIVGETVDMIEKKCIQTALELTKNNRASAAEMLGLSRQSLYVKLRRFEMVSDMEVSSVH